MTMQFSDDARRCTRCVLPANFRNIRFDRNGVCNYCHNHDRLIERFRRFSLAEEVKAHTNGYFDIWHAGKYDPSGLVKGWAILNAADLVRKNGFQNFYVEAGGDFQVDGKNSQGQDWRVGIRNPFNVDEIVKVLSISDCGVATSGSYIRGQHIYNPMNDNDPIPDIVSLTVIGPDICMADSFATAAFAMGHPGITFIESLDGFEGYMIDKERQATFTSGFTRYVSLD